MALAAPRVMAPRKNPGACTAAGCASTFVRGAGCTARGRLRRASQSAPAPPGPRPSLQTAAARTRGTVSSACVGRGLVRNACRGLGDMPLSQGRRSTGSAFRAGQQQRLCVARVTTRRQILLVWGATAGWTRTRARVTLAAWLYLRAEWATRSPGWRSWCGPAFSLESC